MSIYIGLGSNKGDRYYNLQLGMKAINKHPHIWILKKSYIYQSPPMYNIDQEDFYNMVLEIDTNLDPIQLLNSFQRIEKKYGRIFDNSKNMPRELDIDILAIGELLVRTNLLNIPHLKIYERDFVLKPWNDLAPEFYVVSEDKTVREMFEAVSSNNMLRMILDVENKK